jgi:hypothetical protein
MIQVAVGQQYFPNCNVLGSDSVLNVRKITTGIHDGRIACPGAPHQ